ncbi:MAG: hypothetical protein IH987_16105 [Planctomycetes bacterium]|nr:hypothetical protein [Planctomycetota bacterium]
MQIPSNTQQRIIIDYLATLTDAPDAFLHGATLSLCASLLGKRVVTPFAGRELTPCLWIVLVGRSTKLRKTTTQS